MSADPADLFSPDYATARERFRAAAAAAGADLEALDLDSRGPRGEALAIDIAWWGPADAARLLLHTSGLHGVEAYAGAAVQLAAIARAPRPPRDCAFALAHVVNPWGMAWSRRTNAENVDLNRNFLSAGESWSGAAPLYGLIDAFLNPPSPPGRDGFIPGIARLVARHGYRALRQAIAEGQYDYPRGLFYGGAQLQPESRLLLDWLARRCRAARRVFAIDLHTGLGARGAQTLMLESAASLPVDLAAALGTRLGRPARGESAYRIRGGMGVAIARTLPDAAVDVLLQEIGTRSPLAVLRALREENRLHHHGTGAPDHPVRAALREAFAPASRAWRRRALAHGLRLLDAARDFTFRTGAANSVAGARKA